MSRLNLPDYDDENPVLQAAYLYERHGLSVIPVHERDKLPVGKWKIRQTTRNIVTELTAHFQGSGSMLNIGIVTGSVSGELVVLDVDPRDGGNESLANLIMNGLKLPDTVHCKTGSGGDHYYFRAPIGTVTRIRNSASSLGPGLDIRAEGGQVVAPPSIHACGNEYAWSADHGIGEIGIAPIPQRLLDLVLQEIDDDPADGELIKVINDTTKTVSSLGLLINGRKNYMAEVVAKSYATLSVLRLGHPLTEQEMFSHCWPVYFGNVEGNEIELERNGRGKSLMLEKVRYILTPERQEYLQQQGLSAANSTGAQLGKAGRDGQQDSPVAAPGRSFHSQPLTKLSLSERERRQFLVPYRHMRGHITMTAAAPGLGKSTFGIQEAVSMATGLDFLKLGVGSEPVRVYILNNEETRDEIERRIEATCTYFGVPVDGHILSNLFIHSGVDSHKFRAAASVRDQVMPTEDLVTLQELLVDLKIDLLIIDPFVQAHHVPEGSNEQISQVMNLIRSMAGPNTAVHIIHHARKPPPGSSTAAGDMFSARGAGSMASEAHFVFTMTDMTEKEAESFGIAKEERNLYLRQDDAKGKFRPPEGASWLLRHGQHMPYGGMIGEEIGVLVPWEPPEHALSDWGYTRTSPLLDAIQRSWDAGKPLSAHVQGRDRYVVNVLIAEHGVPRSVAKKLLAQWLRDGTLIEDQIDGRSKAKGLHTAAQGVVSD
jgi:hypothetical protein|tara:strand:- start:79 stop:2214 length:2136 start_codon:yes stop_codon:yes gene_type:complete